ncbi:chromate resistance protein ChrB domain-containing protein [Larkinella terrae]|uniref:Helix-turn-helix domain-containing protein n=1 Tax=Larkinella terrae TaxID=2025311 RepID=A0A7K0EPC6_9BACT|nr:chromate resistance protein ChrB domain-containing protein [Larkinella terrae]MRS63298.1 helix-turn-helix domain-containing protein [Larkinella terrae]
MKWITRERPKIDRIACPWLIKRFIDRDAEIIFVPDSQVKVQAEVLQAIPFDVPGVEFTHYENRCTFDYFLEKYELKDPALHIMAPIIRGADTDDHSVASQSAGLWAISAGMAFMIRDDHELVEKGMLIYDSLYSWAKYLPQAKHVQSPVENLLLQIHRTYLSQKGRKKAKAPIWTIELRDLIQNHVDTNLNLSLKTVSEDLNINPTYLSREFSRYFDDLSFGEYIRKARIEKAIQLLESSQNTLSEIAYLTGFSDQSHFTRIFRQHTGKKPSEFRKNLAKRKADSKG